MKIVFAQGNPGKQYERSRHNVGFIVLDQLAESLSASWKEESKFRASVAATTINSETVLLVKPHTFYNETGQSARAIVDFYKLTPATDVLVIHDELALPFGTIRVREKGSDAGNNGIKSLNAHLGPDYARIRIGIWNELRDRVDDAQFVLSGFTKDEASLLHSEVTSVVVPLINDFIKGQLAPVSHSIN